MILEHYGRAEENLVARNYLSDSCPLENLHKLAYLPRSSASRGNYQPIVPRQKHSIVAR